MDRLISSLETVNQQSFTNDTERARFEYAALSAIRQAQHPWDVVREQLASAVSGSAVKTLIDAGLWKSWLKAGGQPSTTETLAELSGVDPELLRRLLRALAGQRYILETGPDTFSLTPYSRALASDVFTGVYTVSTEFMNPCIMNFPLFAAGAHGYRNPTDPSLTNLQHWSGRGSDHTFFTHLAENPRLNQAFNLNMKAYSEAKVPWVELYPIEEEIVKPAKAGPPGKAWLVDVAGGIGHDLEHFRARVPDAPPGALVLQDQPQVVANAVLKAPCEAQAYDFFTPQTLGGARAYYLHMILHDWSDVDAIRILRNLAAGMEGGYSRLLVHEVVIASRGANPRATVSDLTMMMCLGGVERTEEMWGRLAEGAGLRIRKVWTKPESEESILEMVLQEEA